MVNSMCPGWCRTEIGGPSAPLSADEGADPLVWLALDAPQSLHGSLVKQRTVIAWWTNEHASGSFIVRPKTEFYGCSHDAAGAMIDDTTDNCHPDSPPFGGLLLRSGSAAKS
jgi:hypothetical protein